MIAEKTFSFLKLRDAFTSIGIGEALDMAFIPFLFT